MKETRSTGTKKFKEARQPGAERTKYVSTGLPKLIPRTHDDYLYSVRESARICALRPESVYLAVLPAAHNFPLSSPGVLGALHAGATTVMSPSPDAGTAFRLIESEKVTITGVVPPLAAAWVQAAAHTDRDLSSLQVILVGGAKCSRELAERIGPALGCQLQQVFGMAEGLVNYTRLDDPDEVIFTTQGRPISPDDEVKIVDEDGQPVAEGETGEEIYLRGAVISPDGSRCHRLSRSLAVPTDGGAAAALAAAQEVGQSLAVDLLDAGADKILDASAPSGAQAQEDAPLPSGAQTQDMGATENDPHP